MGALIEGTLKLFLSVHYSDFQGDEQKLKAAGAFDFKTNISKSPDGLTLEHLRKYVLASDLIDISGKELLRLVQQRRNAVHAFKDPPIGNGQEFWEAVHEYFELLIDLNGLLPYP